MFAWLEDTCLRTNNTSDTDRSEAKEVMIAAIIGQLQNSMHLMLSVDKHCILYRKWRNYV